MSSSDYSNLQWDDFKKLNFSDNYYTFDLFNILQKIKKINLYISKLRELVSLQI